MTPPLPELPLTSWEATKDTLHLWAQIVGKVRMASSAPRNHWWHVPLYVDVRGLTTRRLHASSGVTFEIAFDFISHRLVVETNGGEIESFELVDGLSVAAFDEELHAALARLDIDVTIRESPFSLPMTTPFPEDREHASYDRDAAERFWHILDWTDGVFEEFAGWYCGKSSPVHLFWHSFDLALSRFSGKRAPPLPDADPVTQEAYSHEVISFGFWAGDQNVREPAYYSYTAPEPADLRRRLLQPDEAFWVEQATGSLALLRYEVVRTAADPKRTLLAFLESAYRAGAGASGWDAAHLTSSWCPNPPELSDFLRTEHELGDGLDGNAIAGLLFDVFGAELTTATGECMNCGARGPIAETEVYLRAPGTVVRCRSCRNVLMVLATVRGTTCVDLRGLARLEPA